MNQDWKSLLERILTDLLKFKIVTFPRAFFKSKRPLDLRLRLVNQDEYINKKTHEIVNS